MRKKLPCLLLSGALVLSLAACAPNREGPSPSLPLTTPPPEASVPVLETLEPTLYPTPSPAPSSSPDFSAALPERDYQPWQVGYMDFLTNLLRVENDTSLEVTAYDSLAVDQRGVIAEFSIYDEPPRPLSYVMSMMSENYSLYDVDKDGVPELFVRYGDCEANFTTQCYTFRDGKVVCIGEFRSGHSSLYTCPDKSAVLRSSGHMGYKEVYEYPMENGVLTEEREIFREEDVRDYTPTEEIVSGAEYIEPYYTRRGEDDSSFFTGKAPYSAGSAMLLPICDWQAGPAATGNDSEQARAAILAALGGESEVYAVSGDHFYGDIGPVAWTDYLGPHGAYPYNDEPLEVSAHLWQDMNGDGQEELLLRVVTDVGEDHGTPWVSEATVMLSGQGGVVYAYCFDFYERDDFCTDGAIRGYGQVYRLSFWNDQCYRYIAEGAEADPVKWLDGSPLS